MRKKMKWEYWTKTRIMRWDNFWIRLRILKIGYWKLRISRKSQIHMRMLLTCNLNLVKAAVYMDPSNLTSLLAMTLKQHPNYRSSIVLLFISNNNSKISCQHLRNNISELLQQVPHHFHKHKNCHFQRRN